MTAIVLMGTTSLPIVAENVRAWRIFRTKRETIMAAGAGERVSPAPRKRPQTGKGRSAALTAIGQAAPIQARAKRGGKAIPARRLGHDEPEAKENGDQRHAEQQPQVHFKPLLFARDIAETVGMGTSRSFQ